MAGFLDDMSSLLSGILPSSFAPPDYGAPPAPAPSPTATPSLPSVSNVLARIKQFAPPNSAPPGPLGVGTPIGGGNLAASLGGLAQVNPHSSRFGAFAQGLAGGISAQQEAQYKDQQLGIARQSAGLENALKSAQLANLLRGQNAIDQAAGIDGRTANGYAAGYTGPGSDASPSSPAPLAGPQAGQAPQALRDLAAASTAGQPATAAPATAPAAGAPPAAATGPGADAPQEPRTVTVAPSIADTANFWKRVPPEQNPYFLRWRAGVMDQKALVPGLPADVANNYARQAQQDRQSANSITDTVFMRDGTKVLIPGAIESEARKAAAVEGAKFHAQKTEEFNAAPGVGISGTPYLPNPSAAPAPAAPLQGGRMVSPSLGQPQMQAPAAGQSPASPTMPSPQASQASTATIDPETASIRTAIPTAPAGGGYPMPADLPPGAKMTGLSPAGKAVQEADKDFYAAMGNAPALDQTIERFRSMAQAFKLFQSGSGDEKLQGAAALAQSFGRKDLAQLILGGDPDAYQWIEKEGAPLALNQLKSATTKFTQAEFKTTYGTSIPNPEKLPQANHQMVAEGLAQAQARKQFNSDWQQAQQQGWQSPSAFYQSWVKANPPSMFIKSAQRQLGTFKGMDLPPPTEWASGAIYAAPKSMNAQQHAAFDRYGLQPGGLFRFNGWKNNKPVEPINPAHGFSSYLDR